MSLLDTIQDQQASYARGLKEGIAIGKRESAAAIADLREALRPFAKEFEIADAAGELQYWPSSEAKNCEAAWKALSKHAATP